MSQLDNSPQQAPPEVPNEQTGATRRSLLKTAGLVALVGGGGAALAGCSPSTTTEPAATTAPSSAPASSASASASSAPASSAASSASPTASSSSAAATGPSVTKAQVPQGGGIILKDADYVVTQPSKGEYKAFNKMCTHQGCPVSQIADAEIVCRCHNSHFSIEDGSVISGPAKAPLAEVKTTVSGDNIVISA